MAKRKNYSADEKVKLLKEHLIEKVPVSKICERIGLNPNVFSTGRSSFLKMEQRHSAKRPKAVRFHMIND